MKPTLHKIAKVSLEELVFAYEVGGRAASNQIPRSGVGGMGVTIGNEDGSAQRIELTDTPLNRAMIAIRDQFPKGQLQPLMLRLMAMSEMLKKPEAEPYIRPAPAHKGEYEVSEAVFRVAAEMPLNANLLFNRSTFFKRVGAIYKVNPD